GRLVQRGLRDDYLVALPGCGTVDHLPRDRFHQTTRGNRGTDARLNDLRLRCKGRGFQLLTLVVGHSSRRPAQCHTGDGEDELGAAHGGTLYEARRQRKYILTAVRTE